MTADVSAPLARQATGSDAPTDLLDSVQDLFAWQPAHLPISDPGHLPLLHWLTRQIRPKLGLCLGVGDGGVYFTLCEAARLQSAPAQIFGIDIWTGADGMPVQGIPRDLAEYAQAHYPGLARLVCANPVHAAEIFDLGNIDLLVVEQPLSAEMLDHLAEVWVPLISAQGAIVLRGIVSPEGAEDHMPQLDALRTRWPHLAVLEGSGVLVLLTGTTPPPRLAFLCQTEADTPLRAQALGVLHWLGAALADRQARSTAMAEIMQLKAAQISVAQEKDILQQQLNTLQQDLAGQTERLARRDATIASLTQDAEAQAKRLSTLETELADHQTALHSLTSQAETLRVEKDALAQERQAAQETCDALQAQLAQAHAEAQQTRAQMEARLAGQTERLARRDATIASLTQDAEAQAKRLNTLETELADHQTALHSLTSQAETLRVEKDALAQERQAAQETCDTLQAQLAQAHAEAQQTRAQMEAALAGQTEQLARRDATIASLTQDAEAQAKKLSTLEARNSEMSHDLASLTRQAETLHMQMNKVDRQARHLEAEAARRVRELKERLETAVSQREDAREKLVAKRLEANKRVTELKERLETAVNQREEARERLKSLQDAVKARDKDLSKLKLQSLEQTHELAALRNSTSWRVTAPLRGASSLILPRKLR